MKPIVKWGLISLGILVGVTLLVALLLPVLISYKASSYSPPKHVLRAELSFVQHAMNAMMADKNIASVTANDDTNRSLGVNTWTDMPKGLGAAPLGGYLKDDTTEFYFCWDSQGDVYPQNKTDAVAAMPEDAEIQRPCKKAPL